MIKDTGIVICKKCIFISGHDTHEDFNPVYGEVFKKKNRIFSNFLFIK
jgi:hypothetical protein